MKKIFLLIAIVMAVFSNIYSQDSTKHQGRLSIVIDGFESDAGNAMIALVNTEDGYNSNKESFKGMITVIKNKGAGWIVKNLQFGEYAVKVFHDENENGELDTNFLGIPNEAYGFSNNPPARFGPPDWADAKFNFISDSLTITIHVH